MTERMRPAVSTMAVRQSVLRPSTTGSSSRVSSPKVSASAVPLEHSRP